MSGRLSMTSKFSDSSGRRMVVSREPREAVLARHGKKVPRVLGVFDKLRDNSVFAYGCSPRFMAAPVS